jgi:bacteriorhodopsin
MDENLLLGGTILVLVTILLFFSLSFQTPYQKELRYLARQPFFRFMAYLVILLGMDWNPIVGSLTFIGVVLWFYDINLLSS